MLLDEDGPLRFKFDALMGLNATGGEEDAAKASEQLGEGRALLAPKVAATRMRLFEAIRTYGMAIIEGAPVAPDAGRLIADHLVGAVETTVFGYKFVIKKVGEPHNLAFDSISLQQHTDFTYLKKVPDVALFHCISNAESGGDSLWADGFALAEELRRMDPQAFRLLSETSVLFIDVTDKWLLEAEHPTIELAVDGASLARVHFNERTRDSWRQWAPARDGGGGGGGGGPAPAAAATSPAFYDALRKYEALVDRADWHIKTPLRPGDVALFDNARVMHSRKAFVGERHMEGSYMSWENLEATWRALRWQAERAPPVYCGHTVGGSAAA